MNLMRHMWTMCFRWFGKCIKFVRCSRKVEDENTFVAKEKEMMRICRKFIREVSNKISKYEYIIWKSPFFLGCIVCCPNETFKTASVFVESLCGKYYKLHLISIDWRVTMASGWLDRNAFVRNWNKKVPTYHL